MRTLTKQMMHDRELQSNSLKFLQKVINTTSDPIFVKNDRHCWILCNDAFCNFIGISREKLLDKSDYDFFHKSEADIFWQKDRQVLETGIDDENEETLTTLEGSIRIISTKKSRFQDCQGKKYIVGIIRDITSRKHLEEALKQVVEELEYRVEERTAHLKEAIEQLEIEVAERKQVEALLQEKNQKLEQALLELQETQTHLIQSEKMSSLGQLVAGVAHEINNPVNFIHGNLVHANQYMNDLLDLLQLYKAHCPGSHPDLIVKEEEMDLEFLRTDLPKLLSSMQVGADRIRTIVQSLRHFSRIDEAEVKAVDVHEGIESTLMILSNRLKAKPDSPAIEVIKQYEKLPLVECYAGQLNQVFMNIISNAIDALEERINQEIDRQPKICIITDVVEPNLVKIRIKDNALGMPESVRKHLFDPFFTTKPIGKGTGLGMSISYQIVSEKHGGTLDCNSIFGEGTEFIVEIPIQRQH